MPDTTLDHHRTRTFVSRPQGITYLATMESQRLSLVRLPERRIGPWTQRMRDGLLTLAWQAEHPPCLDDVLAALEVTFMCTPGTHRLGLRVPAPLYPELLRLGILVPDADHGHVALHGMLW